MTYTRKLIVLPIISFMLLLYPILVKAQVYVKSDAQGANNGISWADAYTNLDSAINKTASGEIWVAAGTYKPSINFQNNSYQTFNITKKISLYGGFNGDETSMSQRHIQNNLTILSGDVGVAGNDLDNTPKVLAITGSNVDSTCIVDGFTITKAYYTNAAGSYQNAAVYIFTDIYNNRNPVLRNCTIRDNFGFYGAGIYVRSAQPLIYNNLIAGNTAYEGAGIYLDYSGNARVIGNRIVNNRCIGGYSHLSGGGIQVEAYCAPYIYGNLIDNNQSGNYGGGISVESNYSAVISNNIISNNTSRDGGGIYIDFTTTHLINNLIIGNKATGSGGGMYVNYSFASRSVNNTIVSNSSDNYGGAVYLLDGNMQFTNTIIYNNPTKYNKQFNSTNPNRTDWFPRIEYCAIEGGKQGIAFSNPAKLDDIWRVGNISVYPDFIDTTSSNYNLRPQSACVNAGIPDTTGLWLPVTDVAGASRSVGNKVDIGCYEYDSKFINIDSLIVTPATINLEGRSDSTFYLSIHSNTNWSIASTPDWLITGSTSGISPTALKITAKANPSLNIARTGYIVFSRPGIAPVVQVKISQTGGAYLSATPDTIFVDSHLNDSASFNVFSNLSWYLTGYPSWLSLDKSSSSNNARIVAKATIANLSGTNRTTQINVYSSQYNVSPALIRKVVVIQLPDSYILCQNGSDSISAVLNGPTYQWQADTGSGFTNITDNAFYKGTSNKWLQLVNIPTSFNGSKYRCIVGNLMSDVYGLKIQNTWSGSVSTQWEDPLNWGCRKLPDANTDVIITQGNIVVHANTTIRSLTISPGATLTVVAGAHLTILK